MKIYGYKNRIEELNLTIDDLENIIEVATYHVDDDFESFMPYEIDDREYAYLEDVGYIVLIEGVWEDERSEVIAQTHAENDVEFIGGEE